MVNNNSLNPLHSPFYLKVKKRIPGVEKKNTKYKFFIHWMINCVPIKRYPGLKFENDAQDLKEYVGVMSSDNRSKDFFKILVFLCKSQYFLSVVSLSTWRSDFRLQRSDRKTTLWIVHATFFKWFTWNYVYNPFNFELRAGLILSII